MNNYTFKIAVDGGAAFQKIEIVTETAESYEQAEEAAFRKLRAKYSDVIAFFNILDWRRF